MTGIDGKASRGAPDGVGDRRPWTPRLISKLESHIRWRATPELLRINPLRFAADKGLAELGDNRSLPARRRLGLFRDDWILICPICSCVIDSFRALKKLNSHCRCTICHVDLVAALDDMIADHLHGQPIDSPNRHITIRDLSAANYLLRYESAARA